MQNKAAATSCSEDGQMSIVAMTMFVAVESSEGQSETDGKFVHREPAADETSINRGPPLHRRGYGGK